MTDTDIRSTMLDPKNVHGPSAAKRPQKRPCSGLSARALAELDGIHGPATREECKIAKPRFLHRQ